MGIEEILALSMFVMACFCLLSGYPVALTLGGVALGFAGLGYVLGVFEPAFIRVFPLRILGAMQNSILVCVPLFVLMGVVLERSRMAEDLLNIANYLLKQIRGGLGFAVVLVGALLAASTGIVGATVITLTLIALPSMLRAGYSPRLATGIISASGTLGQIIPPSIVLILLADVISNANQSARMSAGLPPSTISVGDLFAGALLPGLMLVGLYILYILFMAITQPKSCPLPDKGGMTEESTQVITFNHILFGFIAPLGLIVAVLGSIIFGLTPPTEAASIGAVGAIWLSGLRLGRDKHGRLNGRGKACLVAILAFIGLLWLNAGLDLRLARDDLGALDWVGIGLASILCIAIAIGIFAGLATLWQKGELEDVLRSTAGITSMVFLILIGASLFSVVFRGFGGDELVEHGLSQMPGGVWGALALTMLVMFLLGFFLDFIEITFVVVPLIAPPLIALGMDPIWLGILMALNLQTSFLTPPFGFALFYLRGAAPETVKTEEIWSGALPFVGLQILAIMLVILFPSIATWLPSQL